MNWLRLTDAQIAMELGRSESAVIDRRVLLGKRRTPGTCGTRKEGVWSEGKVLRTAQEYVEALGDMPTNDKAWMITLRIDQINVCIMAMFDNAPRRKVWGSPDARSLAKMQAMVKDLKSVRDDILLASALNNEAA